MFKNSLKILSALSVLFLSACTQVGIGVANIPAKFSDIEIKKDIAYGDHELQKLDLYIPPQAKKIPLPVIVFFYGGRWTDGSKNMYAFVGKAFTDNGFIVAIADYQKYPKVKFPVFVNDGAKAIAWVHSNIKNYGGNPDQMFVSGHSSGAHIAALVTVDERYLTAEGKNTDIIKAFSGLAGPYDFVPQADDLKDMFGPPENYPQVMPTTFIDGNEPPIQLLWGAKDEAVWERNLKLMKEKIIEKNGKVETKIYPDLDHVGIVSSLTWFLRGKAPVLDDMNKFFQEQLAQEK
jgi:acetyl esterase/lipase